MSYELSVGVKFLGFTGGAKVSGSYRRAISEATKNAYSYNVNNEVEIDCPDDKKSDGGVGLWQWVVQTADETGTVWGLHTVCRYGALYNVMPKCPWNACTNGDCSECDANWTQDWQNFEQ